MLSAHVCSGQLEEKGFYKDWFFPDSRKIVMYLELAPVNPIIGSEGQDVGKAVETVETVEAVESTDEEIYQMLEDNLGQFL